MTFEWPAMLFLLLALPVIMVVYLRVQHNQRARMNSLRWSGAGSDVAPVSAFRRYLAPFLFLISMAILIVALARPHATVQVPRVEGTVMLVFDVSRSMAADDMQPTRLDAAREAARAFVLEQPETVQIGVVAFSGGGLSVQQPTDETQAVIDAIDRLKPQGSTSIGQGILVALTTIAIDAGLMPEEELLPTPEPQQEGEEPIRPEQQLLDHLPEGDYPSSVIIVLSDGENTEEFDPLQVAAAASERAVPVHTLGFGSPTGTTLEVDGFTVFTALNEAALQQIAQVSGGTYIQTGGEQDLQAVYQTLTPQFVIKPEAMEITSILAGAGMIFMLLGAAVSMGMFSRLP